MVGCEGQERKNQVCGLDTCVGDETLCQGVQWGALLGREQSRDTGDSLHLGHVRTHLPLASLAQPVSGQLDE